MSSRPLTLAAITSRTIEEIASAARAVQANVVALKIAWCKRTGQDPATHDIQTPSPGAVLSFREILIDWRIIRDYSLEEIALRLRQAWGEFCVLCWVFPFVDPQKPIDFAHLPANQAIRCCGHIQEKLHEIQTVLWRLKHEQKVRFDANARKNPEFQRQHEIAMGKPVTVYGQTVATCPDEELLCCACEHAGMLAALRWVADDRWAWEAPGIMELTVSGAGK